MIEKAKIQLREKDGQRYADENFYEGLIVLLDLDADTYIDKNKFSDIHQSLKHVVENHHPFVISKVNYHDKTFVARMITSSYDTRNEYNKQLYFPIPGDLERYGFVDKLDQTRAISIYEVTKDLPFSSVYKILGYLPDAVMLQFTQALKKAIANPKSQFKVLEKL